LADEKGRDVALELLPFSVWYAYGFYIFRCQLTFFPIRLVEGHK